MLGFIVFMIIILSLASRPRERWYRGQHYIGGYGGGFGHVPYRSYRINPMPRGPRPMMGPRPMGRGFGPRPMGGMRSSGFGGGHMGGPGGRR